LDVLANVEVNEEQLTEKPLEFYKKIKKKILDPKIAEREASAEKTNETPVE